MDSSSDMEKQSESGKKPNHALAVDKTDSIHTKMMDYDQLLEASG